MTGFRDRSGIALRLRGVHGHLQAVERLVASGRLVDAVIQLRAVRGSVNALAAELYRRRVEDCLAEGLPAAAVGELLAVASLPIRLFDHAVIRAPSRPRLTSRPTHLRTPRRKPLV